MRARELLLAVLALVEPEVADDAREHGFLIGVVVDDEVFGDAERLCVPAKEPRARRVERADPEVAGACRDQALEAIAHLAGGLVRERDREDPPRRHVVLVDEARDPVRDDPGLPAPCACEDEERPPLVEHRLLLARVEGVLGHGRRTYSMVMSDETRRGPRQAERYRPSASPVAGGGAEGPNIGPAAGPCYNGADEARVARRGGRREGGCAGE